MVDDDRAERSPTFAALCGGLVEETNELIAAIGHLCMAAVEWEIDPEPVRELFGW